MKKNLLHFCILFCLMSCVCCLHAQTIRYVKNNGSGNGSSWANASNSLQAMINASANNDEVWVAQGTYLPTDSGGSFSPTDPREKTFYINTGAAVKIYGGFPPSGNPAFNQRNWGLYPTILSGDIGVPNDSSDNSYHVITNLGSNTNALIDGFTIEKGNAQYSNLGTFDNRDFGGGVTVNGTDNGPYFSHCVFTGNIAKAGGAVFFQTCLPIFYNCVFTENKTYGYGLFSGTGGVNNSYDGSCLFSINNGQVLIVNSTFFKNESNGGSYATISNDGGGYLTVFNSIFYGNNPAYFAIANSSLMSVRYSLFEGVIPNVHFLQLDNIENTDPLFVNPANPKGADGKWMTPDDGLVLQSSSSCANTGDSSVYNSLSYTIKDVLGNARLYGNNVDMGAYETAAACATQYTTLNTEICNGDSVTFNGNTYYQTTTATDTFMASNGCDSIITLNLTVNTPEIFFDVFNQTDCNTFTTGGINAYVQGVSPYTYLWSTGDTTSSLDGTIANGSYSLTITDGNNCTATADTLYYRIAPYYTVTFDTVYNGAHTQVTITATCTPPADRYLWSNGDTTLAITVSVGGTYVFQAIKVIPLQFGDVDCHQYDTVPISFLSTGIENLSSDFFYAFPSPAHKTLFIRSRSGQDIFSISILDITGRPIMYQNNLKESEEMDIEWMSNGIYIIKVTDREGKVGLTKFIKE
jgi:hypothetical protein